MAYQNYASTPDQVTNNWRGIGDLQRELSMGMKGQAAEATLAAKSLFRTRAQGIRGAQEQEEEELAASYSSMGINPTQATGRIAEMRGGVSGKLAGALGEAEFGLHQQLGGIIKDTSESRVNVGMFGKNLAFTEYARAKAERAAKKNRRFGMISTALSLGLSGMGLWGLAGGGPFAGLYDKD